jgi:myo-inositol-1(or 4)-monophosphatase
MNSWNLPRVRELLLECGAIALGYFGKTEMNLKDDKTIVTQADRAVEQLLARHFDRPDEGAYMIGEETVEQRDERYIDEAMRGIAWVVDPIDGTAPYAHRMPHWGVSIGYMEGGVLREGAVYLPVTGELFATDGGAVLYGVGTCGEAPELGPFEPVKAPLSEGGLVSISQTVTRQAGFRLPNAIQALCCAVFPMTYLTLGRVMAYIGTLKLWDLAGAFPVLLASGFLARFRDGTDLTREVTDRAYRLSPEDPRRWFVRQPVIFAPSDEVYRYVAGALPPVPA